MIGLLPAPTADQIKELRMKMNLSQKKFAERYGFGFDSVQSWELGRSTPCPTSRLLLHMILRDSKLIDRLVSMISAELCHPE